MASASSANSVRMVRERSVIAWCSARWGAARCALAGHALSIWRSAGLLRLQNRLRPRSPRQGAKLPARAGGVQERQHDKRREQEIGLRHIEHGGRQKISDREEIADDDVAHRQQKEPRAMADHTREQHGKNREDN